MILTEKREIRQKVRGEIAKLTPEDKASISSLIFSKISEMEVFREAKVVALFVSLSDEPQTADFIAQISLNKQIVTPRIEGSEMNFYDISEGFQKGAFGIMEPIATEAVNPAEIDVMIVPGVAFTHDGARLGRGKGFYDKYLSRNGFRAYTIGVCYPYQVVETIPTEPHDKRMDAVIF